MTEREQSVDPAHLVLPAVHFEHRNIAIAVNFVSWRMACFALHLQPVSPVGTQSDQMSICRR